MGSIAGQAQTADHRQFREMRKQYSAALEALGNAESHLALEEFEQAAAELKKYRQFRASLAGDALPAIVKRSLDSWNGRVKTICDRLEDAGIKIERPKPPVVRRRPTQPTRGAATDAKPIDTAEHDTKYGPIKIETLPPEEGNPRYRIWTKRYEIYSELTDQQVPPLEIGKVIEAARDHFELFFACKFPSDEPRWKVEIYASEAHYRQAGRRDSFGASGGGRYMWHTQVVYLYWQPKGTQFTRGLIIHECEHQMHHESGRDPRTGPENVGIGSGRFGFIDEGLATFFEGHHWDRQTDTLGVGVPSSQSRAREAFRRASGRKATFRDLIESPRDYADVWGLMHYLIHNRPEEARAILSSPDDPAKVWGSVFGSLDISEDFHRDYLNWLKKMGEGPTDLCFTSWDEVVAGRSDVRPEPATEEEPQPVDSTKAAAKDSAKRPAKDATKTAPEPGTRRYADPPMPRFRVEADGFQAKEETIKRLLASAGRELWRFFPDHKIEPFVVRHRHGGPMVEFQRNSQGEIVMRLSTRQTLWCQYSFQFAHEFCHILCGYDDDYKGNMWFEESVCEAASLFVLRRMAEAWQHDPPFDHWRDYRNALGEYAQERIGSFKKADRKDLAALFRKHRESLIRDHKFKAVHQPTAIVLLEMFEEDPSRWESVRWLNSTPLQRGETLKTYFGNWYAAVPARHRRFVAEVATMFDVDVKSARAIPRGTRPDQSSKTTATPGQPAPEAVSASEAGWNQWRGAHRDGIVRNSPPLIDALPDGGLAPAWAWTPSEPALQKGWATPLIVGQRVYVLAHDGAESGMPATTESVVCLDLAGGDVIWKCSTPVEIQ